MLSNTNAKPSFFSSDVVTCLNPESNIKGVFPKMLVEICVRDLHKYMIKTSDIFRLDSVVLSMTYKVLMSYATLRLFLIA